MKQYMNASESWPLYDSIVIASNAKTLLSPTYMTSYADLAQYAEVPFFNVRTRSVGIQYNNFDSANKMAFGYEMFSIGISFEPPAVSYNNQAITKTGSDIFFAQELPKHCAFVLRVSQDEKLVQTCTLMPEGAGVSGWATNFSSASVLDPVMSIQNVSTGMNTRTNRFAFRKPIIMPREVNIEGKLIISDYAREVLLKCAGPEVYENDPDSTDNNYPAAAVIRVSMQGKREVQQRNALHYGV